MERALLLQQVSLSYWLTPLRGFGAFVLNELTKLGVRDPCCNSTRVCCTQQRKNSLPMPSLGFFGSVSHRFLIY